MNNMFENAYFGKSYMTRGGDRALFQYKDSCQAHLFTEAEIIDVYLDGTIDSRFFDSSLDIVSEWQEPVDEEKLENLANEESLWLADAPLQERRFKEGFKTGYCKAKNHENFGKDS